MALVLRDQKCSACKEKVDMFPWRQGYRTYYICRPCQDKLHVRIRIGIANLLEGLQRMWRAKY